MIKSEALKMRCFNIEHELQDFIAAYSLALNIDESEVVNKAITHFMYCIEATHEPKSQSQTT